MRRYVCFLIAFGLPALTWGFQAMLIMPGTVKIAPGDFTTVEAYCYQVDLPIPRAPWDPITFMEQEYDKFEQVNGEAYVYFPKLDREIPLQSAINKGYITISGAGSYAKVLFFNNTNQPVEIHFRSQTALGPRGVDLEHYVPRRELGDWGVRFLTEVGCDPEFIQRALWATTSLQDVPEELVRRALPIMAEIRPRSPAVALWAIKECALGREVDLSRIEQYAGRWLEETEIEAIEKTLNVLGYRLVRAHRTEFYQKKFFEKTRNFKQVFTSIRLKVEDESVVPYILTVYRKGDRVGYVATPIKEGKPDPSRSLYLIGKIVEEEEGRLTIQREDLETGEVTQRTEIPFQTEKQLKLHIEAKEVPFFVDASMAWLDCSNIKPEEFLRSKSFREFVSKASPDLIATVHAISLLQGREDTQWLYLAAIGNSVLLQLSDRIYLRSLVEVKNELVPNGKELPKKFREIPQGKRLVIVNQWDSELTPDLVKGLRGMEKWEKVFADENPRLAWYNIYLRLPKLTVKENVGVVIDRKSLFTTGVKVEEIDELRDSLTQANIPVKEELKELGYLRETNILVIAAHNDKQLRALLADLGKTQALADKVIVAFICNQDGNRHWVGELVRKYEAASVIAYPGLIHFATVKVLMEELLEVMKANPNLTIDEALYQALQQALAKPDIEEWQKDELQWMLDCHWQQISFESRALNLG